MKTLLFFTLQYFTLAFSDQSNVKVDTIKDYKYFYSAELDYPSDSINNIQVKVFSRFGIEINQIVNKELYIRAIDWLGVRYKYGHNSRNGIDCSSFVKTMITGLLVDNLLGGASDIYFQCIPIERSILSEGDLVFFKVNKPYISHVGIYLQNDKFIHATVTEGVIISDLNEVYYQKYYYASGRLKKN